MSLNRAFLIISISSLLLSFSANAQHDKQPTPASAPAVSSAPVPSPTTTTTTTTTPFKASSIEPAVIQTATSSVPGSQNLEMSPVEVKARVNKIEKNMMVTMQKTEDFMRIIKKRLVATPGESIAEECLKTCIEVYEAAIDDIKNSIEDLESGNYYKVNVDISAVYTDVDTCQECYVEMLGEDPELKKFDDWVKGVTSECLGDLETVSG